MEAFKHVLKEQKSQHRHETEQLRQMYKSSELFNNQKLDQLKTTTLTLRNELDNQNVFRAQ
jgi:hypothetical protein